MRRMGEKEDRIAAQEIARRLRTARVGKIIWRKRLPDGHGMVRSTGMRAGGGNVEGPRYRWEYVFERGKIDIVATVRQFSANRLLSLIEP